MPSLLDRHRDVVTVYPEELVTDADGNTRTRPSSVGVVTRATIQPAGVPEEDTDVGFDAEGVYRMKLPRGFPLLGAQSEIVWKDQTWQIDGDPDYNNGSRRTAHLTYQIRRN
ncbi:hypothetical protein GTV32_02725 [Gordonia sp. SID5947]|uniref:hypothetical protein n=1 Tax=Gordonia sp. SID5947 TaxID=2690315 RepID=UPI00136D78D9|nr:hypothetical protein [Gordonia sp. SID5947]MYR05299.1 hypothetical protein [Gordonia sp. SID5947]